MKARIIEHPINKHGMLVIAWTGAKDSWDNSPITSKYGKLIQLIARKIT